MLLWLPLQCSDRPIGQSINKHDKNKGILRRITGKAINFQRVNLKENKINTSMKEGSFAIIITIC